MPMHSQTTAPVAALCAAVATCLLATTVVADPAPAATGSINVEESAEKQLADCMAIWEPRTQERVAAHLQNVTSESAEPLTRPVTLVLTSRWWQRLVTPEGIALLMSKR